MSNTFYLQDTDFSIKLNVEGNSLSLAFPETRLTVQVGNLIQFMYQNNSSIQSLLDCVTSGIEFLLSNGYSLPLQEGMNDLLDVVIDQRSQKVNWDFQDYVPPQAKELAMHITAQYFATLEGNTKNVYEMHSKYYLQIRLLLQEMGHSSTFLDETTDAIDTLVLNATTNYSRCDGSIGSYVSISEHCSSNFINEYLLYRYQNQGLSQEWYITVASSVLTCLQQLSKVDTHLGFLNNAFSKQVKSIKL